MENFKFMLFSIFILAALVFCGYWAFSTMESGSFHVDAQKQKELEIANENLQKEIVALKKQIALLQNNENIVKEEEKIIPLPETPKPDPVVNNPVLTHQTLINELQKLVDGNIYLKNKSQGPAVGFVQKFLNIYNKTSLRIDNDYGTSTGTAIRAFQKDQGLSVDGEVGPGTLKKMISWLKSQ